MQAVRPAVGMGRRRRRATIYKGKETRVTAMYFIHYGSLYALKGLLYRALDKVYQFDPTTALIGADRGSARKRGKSPCKLLSVCLSHIATRERSRSSTKLSSADSHVWGDNVLRGDRLAGEAR